MNDIIILALLFDRPKHGYQLKREAGFILAHGDMHNNLIYPMLHRFTNQRWVRRKAIPGQRGQTRQQYALTAKGREELLERLAEYSEQDSRSPYAFAARVGMFKLLPPETRLAILAKREAHLHAREQRLAIMKANVDIGSYGAEVVRFFSAQAQAERAWIARLRRMQKLKSRAEQPAAGSSMG